MFPGYLSGPSAITEVLKIRGLSQAGGKKDEAEEVRL